MIYMFRLLGDMFDHLADVCRGLSICVCPHWWWIIFKEELTIAFTLYCNHVEFKLAFYQKLPHYTT